MAVFRIDRNVGFLNLRSHDGMAIKQARQLSAKNKNSSVNDSREAAAKLAKRRSVIESLQSRKLRLGAAAMNIRNAYSAMIKINDFIQHMKARLNAIVKNYPPFPPGSEERVRYLKSFNAFKKQIDQMTFRYNTKGAQKITSDSAVRKAEGSLQMEDGQNGFSQAISGRDVQPGMRGLYIRELPDNATDAEIETAIANLGHAKELLKSMERALAEDSARVIASQDFNFEGIGAELKSQEKLDVSDIPEDIAEQMSVELQHRLAGETDNGLTQIQAEFQEMVG